MIPKIIHYCWFSRGKKSKLAKKCINSWKKFCPDYKIIEWNEDNFDLNYNSYVKYCYKNKKWAFLSDFVRLVVVSKYGGLYLDTDVEVLQSFDPLLSYQAFFSFENNENINTGQGFGSEPDHLIVNTMKSLYESIQPLKDGSFPIIRCPELNTKALLPYGLLLNGLRQNIEGAEILPSDFMNPYNDLTGKLTKTKNTFSIHWYGKSWLDKKTVIRSILTKPLHRLQNLFKK